MSGRRNFLIHLAVVVLVALFSFALNHLPFILSGRFDSIGDNGDSAFHLANQMLVRQPDLFPKDVEIREIIYPSRLPSDVVIYRLVVGAADLLFGGNLFLANIVLFWAFHLIFIAGYYGLGLTVLGAPAKGAMFAALYVLPAPAVHAWTGMGYGALVPHALGIALLPWCLLGYLRWSGRFQERPRYLYLLFFLMGLSVNIYPQYPIYAFLIIVPTALICREAKGGQLVLASLMFGIGAAPTVAHSLFRTLSRFSALPFSEQVIAQVLFDRYYSFLIRPGVFLRGLMRLRLWFYVALGGLIYGYKWLTVRLTRLEKRAVAMTLSCIAVVLVGGVASMLLRPVVTLLFTRASALFYLGSYLACAWLAGRWFGRHTLARTTLAIGLLGLFAVNGLLAAPLLNHLCGNLNAQSTPDYYALSDWAAQATAPDSLFMVPMRPSDSYYAFRVYAGRGVTMQWGTGDMVMSNPRGAVTYYWPMSLDILPLYTEGVDTTDFVRMAHKYHVDYIVADRVTPRLPDLPLAYRNGTYTVFVVPSELGSNSVRWPGDTSWVSRPERE